MSTMTAALFGKGPATPPVEPGRPPARPATRRVALDLTWTPPAGFFAEFDAYVDPLTDAPACYRPFVALTILSALAGRRVTALFGFKKVVLNTYTVLLGASSLFRKSTMIDLAEDFIGAIDPEVVLPNETTPERFLKLLEKNPRGTFLWREFTGFLARANRDYNAGLREILMELYDAPRAYRRELQSGTVTVEHPTITILTASATAWLADSFKGGDLRSGFTNRFGFVLAEHKTRWYAIPALPDEAQREALLRRLRAFSGLSGTADLTAIHRPYTAWLKDHEAQLLRAPNVETLSGFFTRLSIAAIKYAVLIELATSGRLQVSPDSLDAALALVDFQKAGIAHLLRVELSATDSGKQLQRVLQVITRKPGVTRKALLQATGYKSAELTPLLETLLEREDITFHDGQFHPAGEAGG